MDTQVLILLFSFTVLLLLNAPIAICIGMATVLTVFSLGTVSTDYIVAQRLSTGIASFPLLAIPFFVLSGVLMGEGGMARRLVDFANALVGRYRGGLSYVNTSTCMMFGAVSGSAAAAVSSIGGFMIPEMTRKGYGKDFSVALTTASATTGLLIPPSNIMIVYAVVAGNVSVAALFMAGVLPGLVIGLLLMAASWLICRNTGVAVQGLTKEATRRGLIGAVGIGLLSAIPIVLAYGVGAMLIIALAGAGVGFVVGVMHRSMVGMAWGAGAGLALSLVLAATGDSEASYWQAACQAMVVWLPSAALFGAVATAAPKEFFGAIPSIFLIVIVLGGILGGVFSATEASAVAVAYALFIGCGVYREVKLKALPEILLKSVKTTAIVMLLVGASQAMSWVLTFEQVPQTVSAALIGITENPIMTLLILNMLLLVVGTFMDMTPAVLIFTPIFLPVVERMGMDPTHFGIVIIANLCIGLCTPPVGTCLFLGCSVGNTTIANVIKPMIPIFIAMFIGLLLITYVPALSMWLPNLLEL